MAATSSSDHCALCTRGFCLREAQQLHGLQLTSDLHLLMVCSPAEVLIALHLECCCKCLTLILRSLLRCLLCWPRRLPLCAYSPLPQ